jgi:hypothetical protein
MIFGYSIAECKKALVAGLYVIFAAVMLIGFAPPVGFESAVLAIVGPLGAVVLVFEAKNHTPDDVQKALEALKAAVFSAIAYYVTIPNSTGEAITMLIAGVVMYLGVKYIPNEGAGAPGHGGTVEARGP